MVAFCLFGAGLIGTVHAANIAAHPGADLRTVVDIDAAAGRALADKHGATFSENAEAAIGDPEIDAVQKLPYEISVLSCLGPGMPGWGRFYDYGGIALPVVGMYSTFLPQDAVKYEVRTLEVS